MGLQQVKPYVLHLFFSNKYTYAQIIQNPKGSVVAAASTIEKALRTQASARIGELLAERAKQAGVPAVHWRRKHGQRYHGKIKELLQSMTAAGLPLN